MPLPREPSLAESAPGSEKSPPYFVKAGLDRPGRRLGSSCPRPPPHPKVPIRLTPTPIPTLRSIRGECRGARPLPWEPLAAELTPSPSTHPSRHASFSKACGEEASCQGRFWAKLT